MYGRGENSIAEQLGVTLDEAIQLKEDVYKALPKLKEIIDKGFEDIRKKGYVLTLWGYKRRLPDFNLPEIQVFYGKTEEDKIINTNVELPSIVSEPIIQKYLSVKYEKRNNFIEKLKKERKYILVDNRKKIATAGRQILNSKVQGTSANMTKIALLKMYENEMLKKLRCYPLIPVHDEIIAISPLRYAKKTSELFAKDMEDAPKDKIEVDIKCDVEVFENWAGESIKELMDEELREEKEWKEV